MIVSQLVTEFYELLIRKKVLIFATCDVDSLATVKILQQLFRIDSIYNILVPVTDYEDLKKAYVPYADNMKFIVLVNCGGTIDVLHFFEEIPKDTVFYIIDHQRPLSVFNIYDSSNRIRLVTTLDNEDIPAAEDVFDEISEDEGPESEDEEELSLDETIRFYQVQHRRKKRQAKHDRRAKRGAEKQQNMYDYTQYHYFSKPSAFIMLNLAMELGQATPEIVWWASVGITHCYQLRRMDRYEYCKYVTFIDSEVSRIAHKNHNTRFDFKISLVNEVDLLLYKHWSVWESANNTPSWILTFILWNDTGLRKLKLFFAESGMATEKLKLDYDYMPRQVKDRLEPSIRKREEKYSFHTWQISTFLAKYGCTYTYTVMDIQMAAVGILDGNSHYKSVDVKYQDGLECLRKEGLQVVKYGITLSKAMLTSINKQVRLLLMMDLVTPFTSVLIGKFVEREFNFKYNTSTSYMKMFARFCQEAYVVQHKVRKYKHMPFVLLVPASQEYVMIIGEAPLTHDSPRTQFKRVYEMVAKKMNEPDSVRLDCFDPSMCKVKSEYRDEFVEKLISVLSP